MRVLVLIAMALALSACAGPPPQRPDCAQTVHKPPKDGGIGGTGNEDRCAE